jgi:outer membrane protein OmpA-like peptidoglycan-associated protein
MRTTAFLIAFLLFALFQDGKAQAQIKQYYVVIGVFANENNAKTFIGFARSRLFQSTHELNKDLNLFYVYVIRTTDRQEAMDQLATLRAVPVFRDSWIFYGNLGEDSAPIAKDDTQELPKDSVHVTEVRNVVNPSTYGMAKEAPAITRETQIARTKPKRTVRGKLFKLDVRTIEGVPMVRNVHHVDLLKGRDIASYPSNDYLDLPPPPRDLMTFVSEVFGYKEVIKMVEYEDPSLAEGVTLDEESAWTIPFNLERLKKGDVSVMYGVSFHENAVMMLPDSQEDLDELVEMMQANPGYRIKIHGHTNGNNKLLRISTFGKTRNYFDLEGASQKTSSAVELSRLRAQALCDYLEEHDIDKSRVDIKAWGGSHMLVAKKSSSARFNDRIEVEILED